MIRIDQARVAVLASTAAEAAVAARRILRRLPAAALAPASLDGYLRTPDAPSRVVLCVTGRSGGPARAFLARSMERLLWPAPAHDLLDAIVGLRSDASPRQPTRPAAPGTRRSDAGPRRALLLEGAVDAGRARAALRSEPRDWIVESTRHVRVGPRVLGALARAGVVWSALEPVELVAVFAAAPLPLDLGLPAGTPIWIEAASRAPAR
jgi:hypothetical protein